MISKQGEFERRFKCRLHDGRGYWYASSTIDILGRRLPLVGAGKSMHEACNDLDAIRNEHLKTLKERRR